VSWSPTITEKKKKTRNADNVVARGEGRGGEKGLRLSSRTTRETRSSSSEGGRGIGLPVCITRGERRGKRPSRKRWSLSEGKGLFHSSGKRKIRARKGKNPLPVRKETFLVRRGKGGGGSVRPISSEKGKVSYHQRGRIEKTSSQKDSPRLSWEEINGFFSDIIGG